MGKLLNGFCIEYIVSSHKRELFKEKTNKGEKTIQGNMVFIWLHLVVKLQTKIWPYLFITGSQETSGNGTRDPIQAKFTGAIHYTFLDYVMNKIQGASHLAKYCVSVFPRIWTLWMTLECLGRYEQ